MTETVTEFLTLTEQLAKLNRARQDTERKLIQLVGGECPYMFARANGLRAEPLDSTTADCHSKTDAECRACDLLTKGMNLGCWCFVNIFKRKD